jgi:hypothetical protein
MRKFVLSLVALFAMAGLVVAVEVRLVKFDKDKKEVTVKEGDAEKVYKVTDKTKFTVTDAKGENAKEADYAAFEKRASGGKGGKVGGMVEIKADGDKLTEVTWKGAKKKNDK